MVINDQIAVCGYSDASARAPAKSIDLPPFAEITHDYLDMATARGSIALSAGCAKTISRGLRIRRVDWARNR